MQRNLWLLLVMLCLLFWAWLNQFIWLGVIFVAVLLIVALWNRKLNFEPASFQHITDLCLLLLVGIFAYYWIDTKASKAVFPTLRLLPLALLPLLISQYFHESNKVPLAALMMLQRKMADSTAWINIEPLFVAVCLFSAGSAEQGHGAYFPGIVLLLLIFALLQHSISLQKLWLIPVFALVVLLAYGLQLLLLEMQGRLESSINQWLLDKYNTSQTSTAIGQVGRLKLSDEILFRIHSDKPPSIPMLLQTSSYQRYGHGQWYAGSWEDQDIEQQHGIWWLSPAAAQAKTLRIYQSFSRATEPLPLPVDAYALADLDVKGVFIGKGGSVQVDAPPPFAAYTVKYGGQPWWVQPGSRPDMYIAKEELAAIAEVVNSLGLVELKQRLGTQAVLQKIRAYFLQQYTYSTWLTESNHGSHSALADFLLFSHRGHCEYFATATVHLLRYLHIPARYVVGYSMREQASEPGGYLVRGRDAHAWALAEVDGHWQQVDNTPPDWFAMENEMSFFQGFKDLLSQWSFEYKKWRYLDKRDWTNVWLLLLLVLFSFLTWRVLRRIKVEKDEQPVAEVETIDSDWLALETFLVSKGYVRLSGETLIHWANRLHQQELIPLIQLYYKQRFAFNGLSRAEREWLREQTAILREKLK